MVSKPALLVIVFAAADQLNDADGAGRRWFMSLWETAARLGMHEPVDRIAPVDFPRDLASGGRFQVLASRESAGPGIRQALLFGIHDVVGFLAVIAPRSARSWRTSWEAWAAAAPEWDPESAPPAVIGTAVIHLGLIPASCEVRGKAQYPPAELLRTLLPKGRQADFPTGWTLTPDGFRVAEFGIGTTDLPRARNLVLLAPADKEADLDQWAWSSARELPPFTRYLLHCAKVRHQFGIYRSGRQFRAARERVEQTIDNLMRLNTDDADLHQLMRAQQALAAQEADTGGLITSMARIRAMTRTVEIAAANMRAAVPEFSADHGSSPVFEQDGLDAAWLRDMLLDDAEYLQATLDRAVQVSRLVGTRVEQRQTRFQQQLTLLQTSVIGAILMALAVSQTLQYKLPLAGPLQPPVIAVLAAVALVLPGAALRWICGIGDDAPLQPADITFTTLLGSAVGWLATATISRQLLHHLAAPLTTVCFAMVSAVVFLTAGSAGTRLLGRLRGSRADETS